MFQNFILAHELAHVALDHHRDQGPTHHFHLTEGKYGLSNIQKSLKEKEANLGAVFLQCGVRLMDDTLSSFDLAKRAFSDNNEVARAQKYVRLDPFQRILNRPRKSYPRVVF